MLGSPLVIPALALSIALLGQESQKGNQLVKVELLCDRTAVRAGETFTIAAKLSVEKSWHVYWENPGDSGMPTRITISGSPGFSVGDAQFPSPVRDEAEGDIVTFVHTGDVVFLSEVRAPNDLAPGFKALFELDAHWLVCQETCYPGAGKAKLEVPVAGKGSPEPAAANEKLFADARARIPRRWKDLEGAALEWSGSGASYALRIDVPKATALELFPIPGRSTRVSGTASAASANGCRLTVDLAYKEVAPAEPPHLQGVLVVTDARGKSSYRLDTIRTGPSR
jgi:thiol:disulfide interchange protein DsbD